MTRILLLLPALVIAGCYPVHVETYLPKAASGRSYPHQCNIVVGPQANWLFEARDIEVTVALQQINGDVGFSVRVPPGTSVSFQSKSLQWATSPDGPWQETPVEFHADPDGGRYRPRFGVLPVRLTLADDFRMTGETPGFMRLAPFRAYAFSARLASPLPPMFYVKVPTLRQGERDMDFPVLRFSRERAWYLYAVALNC